MRQEIINIYKFDELTEEAKEAARQWVRDTNNENGYFWADEALESIKKGLQAFNCSLDNYSIQWDNTNQSSLKIGTPENAEELTGLRLRTWLINNADTGTLTTAKPYGKYEKRASGKWRYDRYSKILKEESSCPFTGVCYDESFLDPIRKFIQAPDSSTLAELMDSAAFAVLKDVESEIEYQDTDTAIDETIQDKGYEFTENGKRA